MAEKKTTDLNADEATSIAVKDQARKRGSDALAILGEEKETTMIGALLNGAVVSNRRTQDFLSGRICCKNVGRNRPKSPMNKRSGRAYALRRSFGKTAWHYPSAEKKRSLMEGSQTHRPVLGIDAVEPQRKMPPRWSIPNR